MSRIPGLSSGAYASQFQAARLFDMRAELADLNRQLATGRRAETLAGLGANRTGMLDLSARSAETQAFSAAALRGRQRLSLMTGALEHFATLTQRTRSDLTLASGVTTASAVSTAASVGQGRLGEALEQLNTDFDGQFLFAGRASATRPAIEPRLLLDGDGARAGLRTLIDERRQADLGDGKGRLATGLAGSTVSLSEESAGLPFGFKLAGLNGSLSGATLAAPAGVPAAASIALTTVPAVGERILIDLDLPDGSRETLTLTARNSGAAGAEDGSFLIGADATATAANLKAALDLALTGRAATALAASSAMVAADDLTSASVSVPARRIAGPPFAAASAYAAAGSRPAVTWYVGDDDAAGAARSSQTATVDRGLTLGTGARADEPALRRAVAGFAVLAAETGAGGDAVASGRYRALAARASARFSGPQQGQEIRDITTELTYAAGAMGLAKERLASRQAFYEEALADIQTPSMEELSAAILGLQTRLQASYQTTASIARLNLADYLR